MYSATSFPFNTKNINYTVLKYVQHYFTYIAVCKKSLKKIHTASMSLFHYLKFKCIQIIIYMMKMTQFQNIQLL